MDEQQLPYRVTRAGCDIRCGKCQVLGKNAGSYKKPNNSNHKIDPKKPSKKKTPEQVLKIQFIINKCMVL